VMNLLNFLKPRKKEPYVKKDLRETEFVKRQMAYVRELAMDAALVGSPIIEMRIDEMKKFLGV